MVNFKSNLLDRVDLYVLDAAGDISRLAALPSPARSGDLRPVSARDLPTPYPAFRFQLPPGETRTLLARVQSTSVLNFYLTVETPAKFAASRSFEQLIQAVYGAFGIIYLILPTTIALLLRRPIIAGISVLAFSMLSVGFIQAGDANVLLWPEAPWLSWPMLIFAGCLYLFSGSEFTRRVLRLAIYQPVMNRIFLIAQALIGLVLILGWIRQTSLYSVTVAVLGIGHILLLLTAQLRALRIGHTHVWFLLIATGMIGTGIAVRHLVILGVLPYHPVLQNAGVLLLPVDLVIWSLGLVFWLRRLETERTRVAEERAHWQSMGIAAGKHSPQDSQESRDANDANDSATSRSSRSRIRNLPLVETLAEIRRHLEVEQIFRQPELSLADFALRLKIRPDQLSAILNL